jgi:hypothetical protein
MSDSFFDDETDPLRFLPKEIFSGPEQAEAAPVPEAARFAARGIAGIGGFGDRLRRPGSAD